MCALSHTGVVRVDSVYGQVGRSGVDDAFIVPEPN